MRYQVILALCLSLILVGSATFIRSNNNPKPTPTLTGADKSSGFDNDSFSIDDFFSFDAAISTELDTTNLTNTEALSRQLILDYINLASSGQANASTMLALTEKYVDLIPDLTKAETIKISDLKMVSNSKTNFQKYANDLVRHYKEHEKVIEKIQEKTPNTRNLGPAFYTLIGELEKEYSAMATKLKAMPVPNELSAVHLGLVNNQLSSAAAMKAIVEFDKDPAKAMAGLAIMNEKLAESKLILREIDRILIAKGI